MLYAARNLACMYVQFDLYVAEIQSVHAAPLSPMMPHDAFDLSSLHAFELNWAHQDVLSWVETKSQPCHDAVPVGSCMLHTLVAKSVCLVQESHLATPESGASCQPSRASNSRRSLRRNESRRDQPSGYEARGKDQEDQPKRLSGWAKLRMARRMQGNVKAIQVPTVLCAVLLECAV